MKDRIGFSNAIGVSSVGLASGLCQMWNNASISFTLVSFSQNHICGDVVGKGDMRCQFIGKCGWPEEANKHKTWSLLRSLCTNTDTDILVVIGGGFQ